MAAVGDESGGGVEAARPLVCLEDPQRHGRVPRPLERRDRVLEQPPARAPATGAGMDVQRMDVPVFGALRILAEADEPDDRAVGRLGHHGGAR